MKVDGSVTLDHGCSLPANTSNLLPCLCFSLRQTCLPQTYASLGLPQPPPPFQICWIFSQGVERPIKIIH